jgi:transposase
VLFKPSDLAVTNPAPSVRGKPRIEEPQRVQGEMRFEMPEDLLAASHPARLLWNILGTLDLTAFGADCESEEGKAGRSLKSPRMLLTLWLYAIVNGIGSAREIGRLVKTDVAFRWIVGDVQVGHHKLSDFELGMERLSTR